MSEHFRSLAGRDPRLTVRDTDTRTPHDPMSTGMTVTMVGVGIFVVLVIILVARILY